MNSSSFAVILSFLMVISSPIPIVAEPIALSYLTTDLDTESLNTGQIYLIDWAASWCSICKQNQQNMDAIYNNYKSQVTFLTISFAGSRDDIDDVRSMKSDYDWTFALDTQNRASDFGVSNGYVWVINDQLELVQEWPYQVVPQSSMSNILDSLLAGEELSDLRVDITDTSINTNNLSDNPLAIVFIVGIILGAGYLILRTDTQRRSSTEKKKELVESRINAAKKNWDWNKE